MTGEQRAGCFSFFEAAVQTLLEQQVMVHRRMLGPASRLRHLP